MTLPPVPSGSNGPSHAGRSRRPRAGGSARSAVSPPRSRCGRAHYTLAHPDYWEVKSVGVKDGEPTTVIIKNYGSAIIDEGSGAMRGGE